MVKILGEGILNAYEVVREHPAEDRYLEMWLRVMLGSYVTTPSSKTKAFSELTEIIIKLNRPETFSAAVEELYALTERYPEVDLYNTP
jgi:hypothetical protein